MKKSKLAFLTSVRPDPLGDAAQRRAYAFLYAYSLSMKVELWVLVKTQEDRSLKVSGIDLPSVKSHYFELDPTGIEATAAAIIASIEACDHLHLFRSPFLLQHKSAFWDFDEKGEEMAFTAGFNKLDILSFINNCKLVYSTVKFEHGYKLNKIAFVEADQSLQEVSKKIFESLLSLDNWSKLGVSQEQNTFYKKNSDAAQTENST